MSTNRPPLRCELRPAPSRWPGLLRLAFGLALTLVPFTCGLGDGWLLLPALYALLIWRAMAARWPFSAGAFRVPMIADPPPPLALRAEAGEVWVERGAAAPRRLQDAWSLWQVDVLYIDGEAPLWIWPDALDVAARASLRRLLLLSRPR